MLQGGFYEEAERDCRSGVLVCDRLGFIQWANTTFRDVTGYAPEEIVGERVENILRGPETESYAIYRLHCAIQKEVALTGIEVTYYQKNGNPCVMQVDLEPVSLPEGAVGPAQFIIRQTPSEEPSWFDSTVLRKLRRAVRSETTGPQDYSDPTETQLLPDHLNDPRQTGRWD